MPSATGSSWEKYTKKFADDEEEEKKIVPLSEEYVASHLYESWLCTEGDEIWDGFCC
jgi:hypothetical protein